MMWKKTEAQSGALAPPAVKICCIANRQEAAMAIAAGADAIGLVGPMPSGPGVIDDETIRDIAAFVPSHIATFLLTSETSPEAIIAQHQRTGTNTIQLVDSPIPGAHGALRRSLPSVKLVQVIHVQDEKALQEAQTLQSQVDALLLDSGNPGLPVKTLGGTGQTHNWSISREIVAQSKLPVFLAGGLRPGNVSSAIQTVQPFGLDLCSGVRTDGQLDQEKLDAFMKTVHNS